MPPYGTLQFSDEYFVSYGSKGFSDADRRRFVRCLRLLDDNERHPSLRVHALRGDREGQWSASASDQLRIIFRRLPDGRKLLVECSVTTATDHGAAPLRMPQPFGTTVL